MILIDTRALANFISHKVDKTQGFRMEEGNGGVEEGLGICRGVCIRVQDMEITQNFYVLELGRTEVVLGVDWLETLGDIKANF